VSSFQHSSPAGESRNHSPGAHDGAMDEILFLRNRHSSRLCKVHRALPDGTVETDQYPDAYRFDAEAVAFDSIFALAAQIEARVPSGRMLAVRGRIREQGQGQRVSAARWTDINRRVTQGNSPSLEYHPQGHRWVMLDIDGLQVPETWSDDWLHGPSGPEDGVRFALSQLPAWLQGVTCWWQYSNSACVPGKDPRQVRLHLVVVLDRFVDDLSLRKWALLQPVDGALFNANQAHYIAEPIFVGSGDPLIGRRSGLLQGDRNEAVAPPELLSPDQRREAEAEKQREREAQRQRFRERTARNPGYANRAQGRVQRIAERRLERALNHILTAPKSTRNTTIRDECRKVGRVAHLLPLASAYESRLIQAACTSDPKRASQYPKAVRRFLDFGRDHRLEVEDFDLEEHIQPRRVIEGVARAVPAKPKGPQAPRLPLEQARKKAALVLDQAMSNPRAALLLRADCGVGKSTAMLGDPGHGVSSLLVKHAAANPSDVVVYITPTRIAAFDGYRRLKRVFPSVAHSLGRKFDRLGADDLGDWAGHRTVGSELFNCGNERVESAQQEGVSPGAVCNGCRFQQACKKRGRMGFEAEAQRVMERGGILLTTQSSLPHVLRMVGKADARVAAIVYDEEPRFEERTLSLAQLKEVISGSSTLGAWAKDESLRDILEDLANLIRKRARRAEKQLKESKRHWRYEGLALVEDLVAANDSTFDVIAGELRAAGLAAAEASKATRGIPTDLPGFLTTLGDACARAGAGGARVEVYASGYGDRRIQLTTVARPVDIGAETPVVVMSATAHAAKVGAYLGRPLEVQDVRLEQPSQFDLQVIAWHTKSLTLKALRSEPGAIRNCLNLALPKVRDRGGRFVLFVPKSVREGAEGLAAAQEVLEEEVERWGRLGLSVELDHFKSTTAMGSNAYQDFDGVIVLGDALPNISAARGHADAVQAHGGDWDQDVEADFIGFLARSEAEQAIGRLRAPLRSGHRMTIIHCGQHHLPWIAEQQDVPQVVKASPARDESARQLLEVGQMIGLAHVQPSDAEAARPFKAGLKSRSTIKRSWEKGGFSEGLRRYEIRIEGERWRPAVRYASSAPEAISDFTRIHQWVSEQRGESFEGFTMAGLEGGRIRLRRGGLDGDRAASGLLSKPPYKNRAPQEPPYGDVNKSESLEHQALEREQGRGPAGGPAPSGDGSSTILKSSPSPEKTVVRPTPVAPEAEPLPNAWLDSVPVAEGPLVDWRRLRNQWLQQAPAEAVELFDPER